MNALAVHGKKNVLSPIVMLCWAQERGQAICQVLSNPMTPQSLGFAGALEDAAAESTVEDCLSVNMGFVKLI